MNDAFVSITDRIEAFITQSSVASPNDPEVEPAFNALAVELYTLQRSSVAPYHQFCQRKSQPDAVQSWQDIPALPISAFKQADISSLSASDRRRVFFSSGTTAEQRSRHHHNSKSLRLYEASVIEGFRFAVRLPGHAHYVSLTPPAVNVPHSSLVYMIEALSHAFGAEPSIFLGAVDGAGNWELDISRALPTLANCGSDGVPVVIFGTAFNFVHLLDHLEANSQRLALPARSHVIETGGYKGRSRVLSRPELYQRIHELLGVPPSQIVSEYGMCELSSQAYDVGAGWSQSAASRAFRFPPWARFRVVSPEDGRTLPVGEPGLLQVFDVANVRSVLAIQTEDIVMSTPDGFQVLGRAADALPRGCSLMTA